MNFINIFHADSKVLLSKTVSTLAEKELKPGKIYYTMGEVAEMFDVNHSLIRFWEKHFKILKPKKNKKGNRLFTPEDIKNFELIYHLVKERGMTLSGAEKVLEGNSDAVSRDMQITGKLQEIRALLLEIKEELREEKDSSLRVISIKDEHVEEPVFPLREDEEKAAVEYTSTDEPEELTMPEDNSEDESWDDSSTIVEEGMVSENIVEGPVTDELFVAENIIEENITPDCQEQAENDPADFDVEGFISLEKEGLEESEYTEHEDGITEESAPELPPFTAQPLFEVEPTNIPAMDEDLSDEAEIAREIEAETAHENKDNNVIQQSLF